MSKRIRYLLWFIVILLLPAGVSGYLLRGREPMLDNYVSVERTPSIQPDYTDTVIPPNIAPLNFTVREKASRYYAEIYSSAGGKIEIFSETAKIEIPVHKWKLLLNKNKGQNLYFDVYANDGAGRWMRFKTITNTISNEPIDGYLLYRKINPSHSSWRGMGIYQRNLENFDESPILENRFYEGACVNCHTFCNNRPDKMIIGTRSQKYGSSALLAEDGLASKIGTKFTYVSWHPTGRLVAYSINSVKQFFYMAQSEVRGVIDTDSMLAYYDIGSKTVKTAPQFSKKERLETYPSWSPDGRYLYFSSAPILWTDRTEIPPKRYNQVKYDLMRLSYDVNSARWGELETVLSAGDTGLSVLEPRISPDGRWLLFCMCNFGCFPVYHDTSDLYLIDLQAAEKTGRFEYRQLDINSTQSESWHSWSSNSRWIVFSSKRDYGVFTRSYFSYVDKEGKAYKPFVLPQKDPTFYDYYLKTFSVPELITSPMQIRQEQWARLIRSPQATPVEMPVTMATPKAGAFQPSEPWQQRE